MASSVNKPDRWAAWVLLILTLLLYWQTAGFQFVNFDDNIVLTENAHVRAGLTAESVQWALTTNYIYWQPLVYLSHMALVSAFGMDPSAHHLCNALLHAINAALVFLVLRRMRLALWPSAIAAAVFTFHPLRVESVAWVTERKDVLSAFFWLLTMWAYVRYTEAPKDRGRYYLMFAFFVLGLMSKPILVTLPVCLLILDFWPLRRWGAVPMRGLIAEKVPMALLATVVAVLAIKGQQAAGAMATLNDFSLTRRLTNVVRSYAVYIWKTIWPADLAVLYPFPEQYPPLEIIAAAAVLAGVSFAVWRYRNAAPMWLAAWLWYLIVIAPNIGFIQVGPTPYADRFTYLPAILPLAAIATALHAKVGEKLFAGLGAAIAVVLALLSWNQIGVWRDDITLYRHSIAAAPGASLIYMNLGVALQKAGRFNDAIANYQLARQLNDSESDTHLNMGIAYLDLRRPAAALPALFRAIELTPAAAAPRYHLSRALIELGRLDEAVTQIREALTRAPSPGMAASLQMQLGLVAYIRKDDNAALAAFRETLRIDPQHAAAQKNAGIVLGNLGRNAEAIEQLEFYLRTNPEDKEIAAAVTALRAAK